MSAQNGEAPKTVLLALYAITMAVAVSVLLDGEPTARRFAMGGVALGISILALLLVRVMD